MEQNRKKSINWSFIILVVIVFIFRIALTDRIPAWIRQNSPHDDQWIVNRASSLLKGDWLGTYNQYTLIKGCFAPFLLAVSYLLGFSYLKLNTMLYCGACLFFVYSMSPIIKSKIVQLLMLIVLLFNPVSYALSTWQRIYRNGLAQWQLPLIIGCFFRIYIHQMEKWNDILPWSIIGGGTLWAFMNTREDGIWILPFVFCTLAITTASYLYKSRETHERKYKIKVILFLLPVIILALGNGIVCSINKYHYGEFIRNDRNSGNYALVMRDLFLIKPEEEDELLYTSPEYEDKYFTIYLSTINKAYEVSPTLSSLRDNINSAIRSWSHSDDKEEKELYGDFMLFAIRDGIARSGYYKENMRETEELYGRIHKELKEAFDTGLLEKRGLSISALSMPLQKKDLSKIIREFIRALNETIRFKGVETKIGTSKSAERTNWIFEFERISGDRAIIQDDPQKVLTIKGWAFAYDESEKLKGVICNEKGLVIEELPFSGGEDVYNYFRNKGEIYNNAHNCRFSVDFSNFSSVEDLFLKYYYNERLIYEIPVSEIVLHQLIQTDKMCFLLDDVSESSENYAEIEKANVQKFVDRANNVGNFYKCISFPLFLLSVLVMFVIIIKTINNKRRINYNKSISVCLLSLGLLLSIILVVFCVSFVSATTFAAITPLYLSPAYILILMFDTVVISYGIQTFVWEKNIPYE